MTENYIAFRLSNVEALAGINFILQVFALSLVVILALTVISFLLHYKASGKRVEEFRKLTHSAA